MPLAELPPHTERLLYHDAGCAVVLKYPGQICARSPEAAASDSSYLASDWESFFSAGQNGVPAGMPVCVNRLDRPVSGAAVLALNASAAALLSRQFTGSAVEKEYWAIVEGRIADDGKEHLLEHYLSFNTKTQKARVSENPFRAARRARLVWRCIGIGTHYSFLIVRLLTGRTHQIRVQLAAIGLPVKGDIKYGAKRSERLGGIRLHARSLAFRPTAAAERIRVTAPLVLHDSLWTAFMQAAGEYDERAR